MRDSAKTQKLLLLTIAAAAFSIRFFFFTTLEDELRFPDSERYDRIAQGILAGEGFESGRTAPVYPLFLAGVYSVFGHSFYAARTAQALMECVSAILVFLLAKNIFSASAGLFAAGLFAVYPFFIFFSGLILTESLFIMILLLFIYLLRKSVIAPRPGIAALCGITGGVAILVKPVMFYFIPLAFLYFVALEKGSRKKLAAHYALAVFLMLLSSSPWAVYNYYKFGDFRLLSGSSITLYESFNPRATGGPGIERIEWTDEMKKMDEEELEKHFRREAVKFIIENPGRAVHLAFLKQGRFWSPVPNYPEYRNLKYGAAGVLSYGPVLFMAAWLVITERKKWRKFSFVCLPVIFFTLLHTVILGSIRYRVPVDPFLIVLASGKLGRIFTGLFPNFD